MIHPIHPDQSGSATPLLLFDRDRFAALAGITLLEGRPGYARCRMIAGPQHMNALDILHGGAVFTLADFAFAVASNSGDKAAVALNSSINYLRAGGVGEYIAEAREIICQGKVGEYEVRVTNPAGEIIALFHGLAYRKHQSLVEMVAKLPPR